MFPKRVFLLLVLWSGQARFFLFIVVVVVVVVDIVNLRPCFSVSGCPELSVAFIFVSFCFCFE